MSLKTQILITDIPKELFSSQWPNQLENKIFSSEFPQAKKHLQYYTPLQFLNRIVIILDNETIALKIFEFLKLDQSIVDMKAKLYLTESLLKPRSKSATDIDADLPIDKNNLTSDSDHLNNQGFNNDTRPILSLDTNPFHTGISASSLKLGSPTLSPDKTSLESPTLLKFSDDDTKLHSYKEPLPKSNSYTNMSEKADTSSSLNVAKSLKKSNEPQSPSITINNYL